jgi:hypothetical protein
MISPNLSQTQIRPFSHTRETGDCPGRQSGRSRERVEDGGSLAGILFEQLEYLVRYSDQESDRLSRVAAVLLEAFR